MHQGLSNAHILNGEGQRHFSQPTTSLAWKISVDNAYLLNAAVRENKKGAIIQKLIQQRVTDINQLICFAENWRSLMCKDNSEAGETQQLIAIQDSYILNTHNQKLGEV